MSLEVQMKELLIENAPYILSFIAFTLITTWTRLEARRKIIEKAIDSAFFIVENIKHQTESKVDDKLAEGLSQLKSLLAADKVKINPKIEEKAVNRFNELHGKQKAGM
tara:strand:+ start:426 stop:749 length:324 start_codon:yes stop_codon:yes gene_type:complete